MLLQLVEKLVGHQRVQLLSDRLLRKKGPLLCGLFFGFYQRSPTTAAASSLLTDIHPIA
jgi:hypothetical protein